MEKEVLKDLGLSEREISVYLALLKLGTTTTGSIVKSSKVPNSKIYEILDKLIDKGLVSYIFKGKVKHFQASNPKTLLNIYENKKSLLKETIEQLDQIKTKEGPTQKATTYEGIKALKAVFFEMYNHVGRNSEYCVFPLGEQLGNEELTQFWAEVFHKRHAMNIHIRTLPHNSLKSIFEKHYKQYKNIQIRYTNYKFPLGIFIFKGHILNVIWKEKPIAFLIKSEENYERWQIFFNEQWKESKKTL